MTEVGELGRLPPGESWRRALAQVERNRACGTKRRYRIRGRLIEPGWWTYEVSKVPRVREFLPPFTRREVAELSATLPKCAQRARDVHGGDFKVAWPNRRTAARVAAGVGGTAYQCELPAPAIGPHWHITTSKRRGGKARR